MELNEKNLNNFKAKEQSFQRLVNEFETLINIHPKEDLTELGQDILIANNINISRTTAVPFDDWTDYIEAYQRSTKKKLVNKDVYTPEYMAKVFDKDRITGIEDLAKKMKFTGE